MGGHSMRTTLEIAGAIGGRIRRGMALNTPLSEGGMRDKL